MQVVSIVGRELDDERCVVFCHLTGEICINRWGCPFVCSLVCLEHLNQFK